MIKLSKLQLEIYEILKEIPITRTDDHLLYISYWSKHRVIKGIEVSFLDFFKNAKKYKASGFAAVERCRRKLQERFPELKDPKTAEKRFELIQDYEEYALKW